MALVRCGAIRREDRRDADPSLEWEDDPKAGRIEAVDISLFVPPNKMKRRERLKEGKREKERVVCVCGLPRKKVNKTSSFLPLPLIHVRAIPEKGASAVYAQDI